MTDKTMGEKIAEGNPYTEFLKVCGVDTCADDERTMTNSKQAWEEGTRFVLSIEMGGVPLKRLAELAEQGGIVMLDTVRTMVSRYGNDWERHLVHKSWID